MPDFVRRQNNPFWKAPVRGGIAEPSPQWVCPLKEERGLHDQCALERERHYVIDAKSDAQVEGFLQIAQRNLKAANQTSFYHIIINACIYMHMMYIVQYFTVASVYTYEYRIQ